MMEAKEHRRRLSERDAAAYLGPVAVRTLQDWRSKGTGPAYAKLGKRVAYDTTDLDVFVASQRVEPKVHPGVEVMEKAVGSSRHATKIAQAVRCGVKEGVCR